MLDCYESNLSNSSYHRLINKFSRTSVVHVLGFKFQYYNSCASRQTPDSLLQLTAHLTKAGLVDVSSRRSHNNICSSLVPSSMFGRIYFDCCLGQRALRALRTFRQCSLLCCRGCLGLNHFICQENARVLNDKGTSLLLN